MLAALSVHQQADLHSSLIACAEALSDRAEQTALQHVIDRGQLIPVDPDQ
jgi:hypothetical protein